MLLCRIAFILLGLAAAAQVRSDTPPAGLALQPGGVYYQWYQGAWGKLPDFNRETPAGFGVAAGFDLAMVPASQNFAVRYQAYIDIPVAGEYSFYTSPDDGSALYVSDLPVVNNDGLHGTQTRWESLVLHPGRYPLRVEFFQRGGGQQFQTQTAGIYSKGSGLTGWHGRLADLLEAANNGVSSFANISLSGYNVLQSGVRAMPFVVEGGSFDVTLSKYASTDMQNRLRSGVRGLLTSSPHLFASAYGNTKARALDGNAALAQALAGAAVPAGFPATSFGRQLQTVAQIMAGPDDMSTQGRFIPTTAVDQIAATLALWFGVSQSELALVIPRIGYFPTANLGFMPV